MYMCVYIYIKHAELLTKMEEELVARALFYLVRIYSYLCVCVYSYLYVCLHIRRRAAD
jgi:hypothetical protein